MMAGIGLAAAAAVAVGGGTAYVAKDAEPGDMLYNVRAALYQDVSSDSDVEAHLKGAEKAHDEAVSLKASDQLTASEQARLTAEYSAHVNAVAARIAELEAQGDADAATTFRMNLRTVLREYRDVFPTIQVDVEGSSSSSVDSSMDDDDSSASAAWMSASSKNGSSGNHDGMMDDSSEGLNGNVNANVDVDAGN